ncbi:hypothetical protein tb265_30170 [Gemmatimonadetes bacterium T265]|nr:hypothetical protein tb265_30170 [Gemmatimonadetes bacterium T265]
MPPAEPSHLEDAGDRLADEGRVIADEATTVLADALAAVLADPAELGALHPASARDAVEFLVRLGRLTRDEGEAIARRAGGGPPGVVSGS